MDLFFRMLMGHVMGDYILQPLIMAVKKSPRKPMKEATPEERPEEAPAEDVEEKKDPYAVPVGTAIFWSILHSLVYTTSVCLWLWTWRPLVFGLIFLTHWPIDFFSLGSKWLELIRGRTFAQAGADKTPFGPFNVGFTCLVYATVDNWWHIALMTPVVWVLSKGLI